MKPITIRKILVPIDFSKGSLNAVKLAAEMARDYDASIQLLHVADNDFNLLDTDGSLNPMLFRTATKKLGDLAKTIINEYQLNCFYTVEYGNITHSILKAAIDRHIDLIVIGKNGNNGYFDEYAGTQTCQVAEKSRIPVLVVPGNTTSFDFNNILFPVRPLLSAADKYDAIRRIILKSKATVTLLNMRDPEEADQLHIIHQLVTKISEKLALDNVKYKLNYYFEDNCFANEVLKLLNAGTEKFDLAVITSESPGTSDHFHFGYYEKKIIHQSNIPLLLLHAEYPYLQSSEILNELVKDTVIA